MANIVPYSFGGALLSAQHDFATGGHTYKLALYTTNPYTESSTVFAGGTGNGEVDPAGSTNYVAGGNVLTSQAVASSTLVATVDFANAVWGAATTGAATFGAAFGAIYNTNTVDGTADRLVVVLDFGGTKTATAGDFTVAFPDPTSGSPAGTGAIISLNAN
jgi:hypothetical protein|tara:strand:+ start:3177 stop:3659 length:483 start_codon:yes stop_codon:yes gene_type:complete